MISDIPATRLSSGCIFQPYIVHSVCVLGVYLKRPRCVFVCRSPVNVHLLLCLITLRAGSLTEIEREASRTDHVLSRSELVILLCFRHVDTHHSGPRVHCAALCFIKHSRFIVTLDLTLVDITRDMREPKGCRNPSLVSANRRASHTQLSFGAPTPSGATG